MGVTIRGQLIHEGRKHFLREEFILCWVIGGRVVGVGGLISHRAPPLGRRQLAWTAFLDSSAGDPVRESSEPEKLET